jgi:S1-C subfamily serine protease
VRTVVTQVVPDSVAEKAGLKVGDVLLAYAGREIHSLPYYRSLTTQPLESPERELRVRRGANVVVLRVPAGLLGFMGLEYAENALPVRVP